MKKRLAQGWSQVVVGHPGKVAVVLVVLATLSAWRVSKLQINHDQIDLIPEQLPAVQSTKEMIKIIGGVGFLMLPLKGEDLDHVKAVADDLAVRLEALPEVRMVTYKQDVGFVRDRIALFVETDDLKEGAKRIRRKIREVLRKNNPFHISLREKKDVPLDLSDLVDKYRRFNKKDVQDPYYVDTHRKMVLMLVKPTGQATDLASTRTLLSRVEALITDYNASNSRNAKLVEHYDGISKEGTVTYGYTGTYKTNLDDSQSLQAALIPTSVFAFGGIFLYLLFVLRRPSQIILVMANLVVAVMMSFAFCELAIGELNTVTAILGAILMGMGIDFGIHLVYRLREEYTRQGNLPDAIQTTLEHSGSAAFGSAATTSASLYVLCLSDFKGFSHFGLVAGTGVLFTFLLTYTAVPTVYVLVDRVWPSFKNNLVLSERVMQRDATGWRVFPYAKRVIIGASVLTVVLLASALNVDFDYDSRRLFAADRPSLVLQEEIKERYEVSADPVAIHTQTLDETRALYDRLYPPPEGSSIDAVVSVFTLVPEAEQQKENRAILDTLRERLSAITPEMIDDETLRARFPEMLPYLDAQPFTVDDLPPHIIAQFSPVPESGIDGYVTFIYPHAGMWDSRELLRFNDEIAYVEVGERAYYTAGMAVMYAQLARIVVNDGVLFTLLSALLIFCIALVDFRSLRGALLAMLPLCAGLVWMLGLMAVFNWRINFMNIVVFPVVLGYGISAGVHMYHRYQESRSVMVALRHTGAAVAASSITTLVGWAALLLSEHRGLASMGILACFGIASALLVSLTVLPALMQVFERNEGAPKTAVDADGMQRV